ncbi:MAG: response regulator [bacterium]|nr:response regulator [bacterium]
MAYLFDDYDNILEYIKAVEDKWRNLNIPVTYLLGDIYFYIPLACLQLSMKTATEKDKKKYLSKAEEGIKNMKKWADFGPVNFLHKYYLMQAELYRVTGKTREAAEYYDKAVEKAYENEYINEAAIANELAAKFYLHNKRHKLAALYFMEARDCYRKWGAVAKVKHLEENYPKYLSMSIPGSTLSTGTISSETHTTGEFLDVTSIIKASQTLSGEVQLARLLKKMMQILVENAGAQKSMLIENIDDRLLVQAEGTTDGVSGILQRQPVEESEKVPLSVINYVARSEKKLVFDNISKDPNYSSDDYIQKHQPKSVVCFPIIRKEKLSAIVYLENNLLEGAFTPERMNILNTLSSQIAISIENARIYRDLNELNKGLEQKVAERTRELEEMDKAKSRFFANISHEFRTPLTLIMGPLEQILSDNPQKEMKAKARLMLRNSQRLLNLINQLLELARLDSGKMKLEVSEQNIVPFLRNIVMCFESLAAQNKLDLIFNNEDENMPVYFDTEKLEKIITNLLSNAFKYTSAEGSITVTVRKDAGTGGFPSGCVEISVRDTGTGIPGNQLPHIFDRFYRVEGGHEHKHKGSGIGLALIKELVELHHGEIDVRSSCREDHNRGTEFFLRLPMGDEHFEPGEIVEIVEIAAPEDQLPVRKEPSPAYIYTSEEVEEEDVPDESTEAAAGGPPTGKEKKSLILVVDDNPDVRIYIKGALEPRFKVVEAADGKEGILRAKEILPDLIVSDVMMPETDGYELCRVLKKDILTSHIPIILLTARVSEESVLEGLETGADDYITKPFSTSVLTVRVGNLIELRRRLQLERKNRMAFLPEDIPVSPMDDEFYKKLQDTVETHLSDPDFNVEALSRVLQMSQATLYRKVQALTGKSPTLFIRIYRLKRAAQLLGAGVGSVSQVAVKAGFSAPSYFAKCFKEQFHRLPSELLPADGNDSDNVMAETAAPPLEAPLQGKEVILVVEDSEDARNYIRESLETDYRVVEAVDGGEGIARALEIIPDLIISDVMMPGTDGYELCGALKKDVRTSHIPIVLLTARATEASMIRGLETGADDYVTKPFNTNILHARIKNLIALRRFLQQKRNREMALLPAKVSESKIDEKFMKELDAVIAKNLSETEFNVDQLAKKLYMSSATLYRKIQALTGEVPSEYIRSFRLRRAARLFKNNFGSVTEVAFEVGFSSRTYFTRCFKEKFHQLPSVFMASESG